jgi:hypothetical protein
MLLPGGSGGRVRARITVATAWLALAALAETGASATQEGSALPGARAGQRIAVRRATGPASPLPRASGGKIAFVRDGNVWAMGADGRDQRQLTTDGRDRLNEAIGIWYTRPV